MPSLSDRCWIEVSDELAAKLDAACEGGTARYRRHILDAAITAALDAAGFLAYYYVTVVSNDKLVGHVGPISDRNKAERAAQSWRIAKFKAQVDRIPVGDSLTNPVRL